MVAILLVSGVRLARAQEAMPIKVAFEVGQLGLNFQSVAHRTAFERAVGENLAAALKDPKKIPFWTYEVAATAQDARVRAAVVNVRGSRELLLKVVAPPGAGNNVERRLTLYEASYLNALGGVPRSTDVERDIERLFTELGGEDLEALTGALARVEPLAREAIFSGDGPPLGALPLDYKRYCLLARASFTVHAEPHSAQQANVDHIEVMGTGVKTLYKLPGGVRFDALQVRGLHRYSVNGTRSELNQAAPWLKQLRIQQVRLIAPIVADPISCSRLGAVGGP